MGVSRLTILGLAKLAGDALYSFQNSNISFNFELYKGKGCSLYLLLTSVLLAVIKYWFSKSLYSNSNYWTKKEWQDYPYIDYNSFLQDIYW